MDGTLVILLSTLFAGAFVSGLAGFAMGIIVLSVWLHFVQPLQCALLVVAFGLITQGVGVWKLRHAFSWRRVAPFVIGGLIGVPLGTVLLAHSNPGQLKIAVGVFIIAYSLYGLVRPAIRISASGTATDVTVGLANGLLAGLVGLIGILITMWCQLRGFPKDVQRTVAQPVMLAASLTSVVSMSAAGAATVESAKLFLLGVPFVVAGTWVGLKCYGRVSEEGFRRVVLVLLMLSGGSLTASAFRGGV